MWLQGHVRRLWDLLGLVRCLYSVAMINKRKKDRRATAERLSESEQNASAGRPAARIGAFTSLADRMAPYLDEKE